MDLKQLEYFVRVAELGSFTRAALQLGVAQPALSKHLRLLEVELRQNLLIRNGRGALPTEAGKRLLEHGRGILHQVALAKEDLSAARGELSGRVSIGLPPSLSRLLTVPLTQAFQTELPLAKLRLTEGFSVLMLEGMRLGNLDMALLYNPAASADIEQTLLHEEALVLMSNAQSPVRIESASVQAESMPARTESASAHAESASVHAESASVRAEPVEASPKTTITLQATSRLPLILPSRPNAFRQLLDHEMTRLGVKPKIVMEVDGLNAILSLVQEGLGHAVLPTYTLAHYPKSSFVVRAITQPKLTSQLMLVRPSQRPTTLTQQRAKSLLQLVVQQALG
ncbi:MAG: LysR substrate-binding domain-containing protein [Cytophagales bacterium]|nr:LysR substrate-binding domain-containing protein [Cytophagales bacterium]